MSDEIIFILMIICVILKVAKIQNNFFMNFYTLIFNISRLSVILFTQYLSDDAPEISV